MAAAILERHDSRQRTVGPESPRGVLRYTIVDVLDEQIAKGLVESTIPAYYDGLIFQSYDLDPQGGGVWDVSVDYSSKKQDGPDSPTSDSSPKQDGDGPHSALDWDFSFDTTGGTSRIFQYRTAYSKTFDQFVTTARTIAQGLPNKKNYNGAINVRTQGSQDVAEGVEIGVPQFAFTLRGTFLPPLPANFVVNLYRKTHKVNSDKVRVYAQGAWLTFEAGELLFRGATGGIRSGDEAVELSMQFAASENAFLEGIIDGAIDDFNNPVKGILKRGWEYLWFRYEDNVIDDKFVPKAVQAFVGEVYPTTELAPLLTPFNG